LTACSKKKKSATGKKQPSLSLHHHQRKDFTKVTYKKRKEVEKKMTSEELKNIRKWLATLLDSS